STETGKRVLMSAAAGLKKVTLELGGNDPAIVLPDVDVKAVAQQIFWSAFLNSGQTCIAIKRLYIHRDIYAEMANALVEIAKATKVGAANVEGVRLGPVQNRRQYERVLGLIADARANGSHFLCGGDTVEGPGYCVPVTMVDNTPEDSRVVQEEAFGPVLPLLKFNDIENAIARANASPFGLGA